MSARVDYFFRQRLSEAELDLGFELLERADRDLATDIGVYGIITGAEPVPHEPVADLSIDLTSPTRAYDRLGQRVAFGTDQTVALAVDFQGVATEVAGAGNERWVAVFVRFARQLSDARSDGNNVQVFFRRDESFELVVRQGPVSPEGAAPRVPLEPDELLVCDVRRTPGQTQILAADIFTDRRQVFVFASGEAIEVMAAAWTVLEPAAATVQASLDEVDAELSEHFSASTRRHAAVDVDYLPHGFVAATSVGDAIDELVDELSAVEVSPAPSGANRVGAGGVAGIPNALGPGNVGSQLAALLGFGNTHQSNAVDAHNSSAIAATPHAWVAGTSVQAQLQEMVAGLLAQVGPDAGATRIGAQAGPGAPNALAQGNVEAQLSELLAHLNGHVTQSAAAHAATAVNVEDAGGLVGETTVHDALVDAANTYAEDHYEPDDPDAGMHRAIRQPVLGAGMVLLWESAGIEGRVGFRVYIDVTSVHFTLNARWTGSEWARDFTAANSTAIRLATSSFEVLQNNDLLGSSVSFVSWPQRWRIGMGTTNNSTFQASGTVRERGYIGGEARNPLPANNFAVVAGSTTFRVRHPATPSSITLSAVETSAGWNAVPTIRAATRDGFGFRAVQSAGPGETVRWFGTYYAIT